MRTESDRGHEDGRKDGRHVGALGAHNYGERIVHRVPERKILNVFFTEFDVRDMLWDAQRKGSCWRCCGSCHLSRLILV